MASRPRTRHRRWPCHSRRTLIRDSDSSQRQETDRPGARVRPGDGASPLSPLGRRDQSEMGAIAGPSPRNGESLAHQGQPHRRHRPHPRSAGRHTKSRGLRQRRSTHRRPVPAVFTPHIRPPPGQALPPEPLRISRPEPSPDMSPLRADAGGRPDPSTCSPGFRNQPAPKIQNGLGPAATPGAPSLERREKALAGSSEVFNWSSFVSLACLPPKVQRK